MTPYDPAAIAGDYALAATSEIERLPHVIMAADTMDDVAAIIRLAILTAAARMVRESGAVEVLAPVNLINAAVPETPTRADVFERGCSITPAQIRAMQAALANLKRLT